MEAIGPRALAVAMEPALVARASSPVRSFEPTAKELQRHSVAYTRVLAVAMEPARVAQASLSAPSLAFVCTRV
jgi:hypothetical protein